MIFKARISLRSLETAISVANFDVGRFLTLWTAPESLLRRLEPSTRPPGEDRCQRAG